MSLERIINALIDIGLTREHAEVYVFLAKKGPKTIENLTKTLIFDSKELGRTLNSLQKKGLITKNQVLFCALPFEEVLTLLIETRKEQAHSANKTKEELLASWKNQK